MIRLDMMNQNDSIAVTVRVQLVKIDRNILVIFQRLRVSTHLLIFLVGNQDWGLTTAEKQKDAGVDVNAKIHVWGNGYQETEASLAPVV